VTPRTDPGEPGAEPPRQAATWRVLVGMQLAVITIILVTIAVVFLVGLYDSLFVQRSL
jgi:hypothetical protein